MNSNRIENNRILRLVTAAMCLALCMVLPLLTGQIPEIGSMLCPMHLPVLLCGYLCGPLWAGMIGFAAPLVRFVIFGMPPLMPTGIAMAFELAAYGAVAGMLYRLLPKKTVCLYASLIGAMLAGRVLWGVVRVILTGVTGSAFTWAAFMAGAVTNAVPGIILQLVLIPVLVKALERAVPGMGKQ